MNWRNLSVCLLLACCLSASAQEDAEPDPELAAELARLKAELDAVRKEAEKAEQRQSEAQALVERLETRLDTVESTSGESGVQPLDALALAVTANTNLREGPGLNYDVQVTLPNGTPVTGHGVIGDWVRVTAEDGRQGWIYRGLLETRHDGG